MCEPPTEAAVGRRRAQRSGGWTSKESTDSIGTACGEPAGTSRAAHPAAGRFELHGIADPDAGVVAYFAGGHTLPP
jgi:hypothetical protein